MRDRVLAYNIAGLVGAAFAGKLKPFDECFSVPGSGDMSAEGAKMLGALFKLKGRGVPMKVEKISLH